MLLLQYDHDNTFVFLPFLTTSTDEVVALHFSAAQQMDGHLPFGNPWLMDTLIRLFSALLQQVHQDDAGTVSG